MDSLREIFEAISQRIKSPILGYMFLSFLGFNWKPLYFLFFSGESALVKFEYFDTNTSVSSLLWWPVGVGLIAALAAPYISNWGAWWATNPTNAKRLREVSANHKVLQVKNKFLAERENQKAQLEQALIDRAKRDEEVEAIKDETIRNKVKEEIDESREHSFASDGDYSTLSDVLSGEVVHKHKAEKLLTDLSEETKKILRLMGENHKGILRYPFQVSGSEDGISFANGQSIVFESHREQLMFSKAMDFLVNQGILRHLTENEYETTSFGYSVTDALKLDDEIPF